VRRGNLPGFFTAAVVAVCLVGTPSSARAQDKKELKRIERQIDAGRAARKALTRKGANLTKDMTKLRRDIIRAARAAQARETLLTKLEGKIPELKAESERRAKILVARRRQLAGTLGALQRLSRNPPQAFLLSGAPPIEVVRNSMLLRAALPSLKSRAESLRAEINDLDRVRGELASRQRKIKVANTALAGERRRLNVLLGQKAKRKRRTAKASRRLDVRLARLTDKARSLRELFRRLEKRVAPPPDPAPRADPAERPAGIQQTPTPGTMTLPASGTVVERYGGSTGLGNTSKGATFLTRAGAQVVAPFDGRVMFAGPFRGYGQILIIEHGAAYHTLLAGLRRLDVKLGQWLLAGEPVGVMGTSESGPRLYVELRQAGRPINPLPWFAAVNDKVRG
jgi:septal ring factor EnvC (AmiA/AmiB activator)